MPILLHISDPHFGALRPEAAEALSRLALRLSPDAIALTGDITQRARDSEFQAAKAYLDALGAPISLCIPGNHDLPFHSLAGRAFWPYRGYRRHFGDLLEPEVDVPGLLLLGVDTTRRHRIKNGEVSRAQVDRVARRLRGSDPSQLRIVATHHPAMVAREEDRPNRLRGGEAAARSWSEAGADILLGGHIHLPYRVEVGAEGRSGAMLCAQAGTSASARTRHGVPNSVNVLRWGALAEGNPRTCSVERWDWVAKNGEFELSHSVLAAL